MARKYPEPYPIENEGKIARARAWVHFRNKNVLRVLDASGQPGVLDVKTGQTVRDHVRGMVDFVFLDPRRIKKIPPKIPPKPQPAPPPNNPNKPNKPQLPPAGPPNVSPNYPNQPGGNLQNKSTQLPPQRQKEYVPQDMKKDIESKETADGYWQIEPPLDGYYYSTVDSYYDSYTMLWSTRENYTAYNPKMSPSGKRHKFRGVAGPGTMSLPLPRGCQIDMTTWKSPSARIVEDQNGCLAVVSDQLTEIDFEFLTQQAYKDIGPISEDSKFIIGQAGLTQKTNEVIMGLQRSGKSRFDIALAICEYIKTSKKYNLEYQAHIHRTSTTQNYFYNLDESEVLECFSANALFVGIARMLNVPARMCGGHMPKTKKGKSHISNSTGHAWSEIWDGAKWIRTDATPQNQDDHIVEDSEREEVEKKEKMEDQGFDPKNTHERQLYEKYNSIEREVQPQIRRLIRELEALLSKEEVPMKEQGFRSGELVSSKLIDWKVTGEARIFERVLMEEMEPVMNLFEVIAIDRSKSMYISGLIEPALKAAIIRSEVLGYFGVPTCMIFFDDTTTKVMGWEGSVGGKLRGSREQKKTHGVPAKIIKIAESMGKGTNISLLLELAERELEKALQSREGKGKKGSITFIGDGAPSPGAGLSGQPLVDLIKRIGNKFPISAYFLGDEFAAGDLTYYFGQENTVAVPDVRDLPNAMAKQFKRKLSKALQQIS